MKIDGLEADKWQNLVGDCNEGLKARRRWLYWSSETCRLCIIAPIIVPHVATSRVTQVGCMGGRRRQQKLQFF